MSAVLFLLSLSNVYPRDLAERPLSVTLFRKRKGCNTGPEDPAGLRARYSMCKQSVLHVTINYVYALENGKIFPFYRPDN